MNQELIGYIRQQTIAGVSRPEIEKSLAAGGWSPGDIAAAFGAIETMPPTALSQQVPHPAPITTPASISPTPVSNEPVVIAPSTPSSPSGSSHTLRSVLAMVLAIIVLTAAAGGAYAYYAFVATPAPLDIIKKTLQASLSTTSFSFAATSTGEISNTVSNGLPTSANFTIAGNGSMDLHSLTNPLFDLALSVNIGVNTATDTGSLLLSFHAISLDKQMYFNLKEFKVAFSSTDPKEAQLQFFVALANGFATPLENKWILASSSPIASSVGTTSELAAADLAALQAYMTRLSYLSSVQSAGTENIAGVGTYHLKAAIQFDQEFMNLVDKIELDEQPEAAKAPTFKQQMDDLHKALAQEFFVDVWIGKSDYRIYKMLVAPGTFSDSKSGTQLHIREEVMASGYNQPVTVVAPESAEPIEQVMQGLFGGMFGKGTSGVK